jgi:hypothetical protein
LLVLGGVGGAAVGILASGRRPEAEHRRAKFRMDLRALMAGVLRGLSAASDSGALVPSGPARPGPAFQRLEYP